MDDLDETDSEARTWVRLKARTRTTYGFCQLPPAGRRTVGDPAGWIWEADTECNSQGSKQGDPDGPIQVQSPIT